MEWGELNQLCVSKRKKNKPKTNSVTEVIFIFVLGWMYPFISQCCEHLIYI